MEKNLRALFAGSTPREIRDLSLPVNLRVLILSPHPDDFDAIGVTLRFLWRNGHPIEIGVVRTGSGVEDSYRPGLTLGDKADLREREQRGSVHFFGLPDHCLTFLSLKNDSEDQPMDTPANRDALERFVLAKAPDMVFLPHGNDTNSGHSVMYSLFTQVARRVGRPLAAFLNRDPKTVDMRTDLYMSFCPEEADWKAKLLRFHDSQQQRNLRTRGRGLDERILNLNRRIARDLSLDKEYAEEFEIEFYSMGNESLLNTLE